MATRWELIKETFARKPVTTAQIVSDIREGTVKALQPVVQSGARYRQEHPQAAQRISVAVRAPSKKFIEVERKVADRIPTLYQISMKGAKFRESHPVAADKLYTTFQKAHIKTQSVGSITQRNALAGYVNGSYEALQRQPIKTSAMFAVGLGSGKAISIISKVGKAYGAGAKAAKLAKAVQLGLGVQYSKQSINHIMSAPNSYVAGQRAAKMVYTELLPMAAGVKVAQLSPKVYGKKVKVTTEKTLKSSLKTLEKNKSALINKRNIGKRKGSISKKELARLNDQIRTYNGRIQTKRKALLNIRRSTRAKLTEIEVKQQKLEGKTKLTNREMDDLVSSFKPREFGTKKLPPKQASKYNKLKHDIKYLVPRIKALKLKMKRGKGLTKAQTSKLQAELNQHNTRLVNKRKQLLNLRKQVRSKLTEFEVKQKALEAESRGQGKLTEANMNKILKLFDEKPKSKPIRDIGKEFRATSKKTAEAVKRGELTETIMKDGTVAVQKVKIEPVQKVKTKQAVKVVAKQKVKQAVAVKQKVKVATKEKYAIAPRSKPAVAAKTRGRMILTPRSLADVVSLSFAPVGVTVGTGKQKTKGRVILAPKPKQAVASKTSGKLKPMLKASQKQTPMRSAKPMTTKALITPTVIKMPPIAVPLKPTKAKKKAKPKTTQYVIYSSSQLNNRVASLQSLFG